MQTIKPHIQEVILNALPDDYDLAMEVMCQLMANLMLCGDTPWGINKTTTKLKDNLDAYAGT